MATKRRFLLLFLAIGLVTSCSGDGGSEGASTTAGATTETTAAEAATTETTAAEASTTQTTATGGEELPTLRIGVPLPFTGVVAESAEEMRQTFLMYIDQQGGSSADFRSR